MTNVPKEQNPKLNPDQLRMANTLLAEIREKIRDLAAGDADLAFAYTRKVGKELNYDERSSPEKRKRLKKRVRKKQGDLCADCKQQLPERGSVLDRRVAKLGYVESNVEVICRACDAKRQGTRGYT